MKRNFFIALSFLFILSNCSLNDNDNDTNDNFEQFTLTWHLISTTGGIAGINDQFNLDTVVWIFDEPTETLTIENNNTDDTKQDLLDSGTYQFSFVTEGEDSYIFVNGNELGEFTISQTNFIIDENNTSEGQLTDGFIYTFERVVRSN